jgi:hypothetical protein
MSNSNNRTNLLASDQSMIVGVQKLLAQIGSLPVGSQKVTPADIVKIFQERIATGQAAITADAARKSAVKADRDKRRETAAFVSSVKRIVQGMFSSPEELAAFGLQARKAGKKTVTTKATALAKSKATRTARNTMGTKQKKKVKGTVANATTGSPTVATSGASTGPTAATATSASTGSSAVPTPNVSSSPAAAKPLA